MLSAGTGRRRALSNKSVSIVTINIIMAANNYCCDFGFFSRVSASLRCKATVVLALSVQLRKEKSVSCKAVLDPHGQARPSQLNC